MQTIELVGPAANDHGLREPGLNRDNQLREGFIFTLIVHRPHFLEQDPAPLSKSALPALSLVLGNLRHPAIPGRCPRLEHRPGGPLGGRWIPYSLGSVSARQDFVRRPEEKGRVHFITMCEDYYTLAVLYIVATLHPRRWVGKATTKLSRLRRRLPRERPGSSEAPLCAIARTGGVWRVAISH